MDFCIKRRYSALILHLITKASGDLVDMNIENIPERLQIAALLFREALDENKPDFICVYAYKNHENTRGLLHFLSESGNISHQTFLNVILQNNEIVQNLRDRGYSDTIDQILEDQAANNNENETEDTLAPPSLDL